MEMSGQIHVPPPLYPRERSPVPDINKGWVSPTVCVDVLSAAHGLDNTVTALSWLPITIYIYTNLTVSHINPAYMPPPPFTAPFFWALRWASDTAPFSDP